MKKALVFVLVGCSWPGGPPLAALDPAFTFEFASAAPDKFAGIAGKGYGPFEVLVGIRPRDLEGQGGPRGWSMAVTHQPGEPLLEILQVTIDGTNAASLLDRQTGFFMAEIIDPDRNGGQRGFVTSAVLSASEDVVLPADRFSSVISATYRGTHPQVMTYTETELDFQFADHLTGSGGDVVNKVSYLGADRSPELQALKLTLATSPACNPALALGLSAPGVVVDENGGVLRVELPAGQDLVFEATAHLTSALTGPGGEAWSISVQHDPAVLALEWAGTDDTDADRLADPEERILRTRIISGGEASGFISAAILSTTTLKTLPPVGDFSIARARYRLVAPHDTPGARLSTVVRFKDGLKEVSLPVENIITVSGQSERACWKWPLQIEVDVVKGGKVFRRGDASNDSRINLTDVISQVRWIFAGESAPVCPAAFDANGDLAVDTTDIVFLLNFLFWAGEPLPPPRCTPDPRLDDPLACDEARVRCP